MEQANTGAVRIARERQRQIDAEGYSSQHDDDHDNAEIAWAAARYAAPEPIFQAAAGHRVGRSIWSNLWNPWPWEDGIPLSERIRLLEKAGALVAAEIDRLLRIEEKCKS